MSFKEIALAEGKEEVANLFDLDTSSMFIDNITNAFRKHFPNGYFWAAEQKGFGGKIISINLGLIHDQKDCANNIRENDPMMHKMIIHGKGDSFNHDKNVFESLTSGLSIDPEPGSFYAMGRVKTKPRKVTGNLDKIEKALVKFFDKLAKTVKENKDKIYGREKLDDKYFVIK